MGRGLGFRVQGLGFEVQGLGLEGYIGSTIGVIEGDTWRDRISPQRVVSIFCSIPSFPTQHP